MKRRFRGVSLVVALALTTFTTEAFAEETLTIASWGGAYQDAQREAWFNIVAKELGITIKEDTTSGIADVRTQVASGKPTWDLVQQGNYSCAILDKEGLVEPLSDAIQNIDGFKPSMKGKGWISNLVYANVIAWNDKTYPDQKPQNWADFFDTKKFPGGRSMRRSPVYDLEAALIADGVPMDKLYPLDADRAFAKLKSLRDNVTVWWNSGAQSSQVMQDGEVDMSSMWNGRAETIAQAGAPVSRTFNQQMLLTDCWVVPKGAPHKDLAMKAIEIMSRPEVQARIALYINYGPANSKAFDTGVIPEKTAKNLPSYPDNLAKGFILDANYWADHLDELTQRFDLFIQQ